MQAALRCLQTSCKASNRSQNPRLWCITKEWSTKHQAWSKERTKICEPRTLGQLQMLSHLSARMHAVISDKMIERKPKFGVAADFSSRPATPYLLLHFSANHRGHNGMRRHLLKKGAWPGNKACTRTPCNLRHSRAGGHCVGLRYCRIILFFQECCVEKVHELCNTWSIYVMK